MVSVEEFYDQMMAELASNQLTLPTLPEVALRVRDAVSSDEVNAAEIAKVVSTDAALSARLIQVANSPIYRGRVPIDNIQIAISRMGYKVVRNLVTSLVMQQMFQATSDVTDKRLRAIWEHSTQVAAISHALAVMNGTKADEAMLAGLIHDIGALPILVRAEEEPELLENEALLDEYVAKLHTRLGKVILESWDFPAALVAVAAEHEDLQRDSGDAIDLVDIVQVANLQSHIGTAHPLAQVDFTTVPAFEKLGLNAEVSVIDMEGAAEDVAAVQQMLCA